MNKRHIQHLSRTPMMACDGNPSTTAFLPCLLTVIAQGFAATIAGLGSLTPLFSFISVFAFDVINIAPLAIRNLPWKVGGPIV